jgi:hypothetical protein
MIETATEVMKQTSQQELDGKVACDIIDIQQDVDISLDKKISNQQSDKNTNKQRCWQYIVVSITLFLIGVVVSIMYILGIFIKPLQPMSTPVPMPSQTPVSPSNLQQAVPSSSIPEIKPTSTPTHPPSSIQNMLLMAIQ